jgi:HEAT repeat protein
MSRSRRTLVLALLTLLPGAVVSAHGGMYRGPQTGANPGPGSGGALGGTAAGNAPGVLAPGMTPGGGASGPTTIDRSTWDTWWYHNQWPFLALREHVLASGPTSGVDGWFLGDGQKAQRGTLSPTKDQVQKQVVPALLAVLAKEKDNDLVTGALVALAKIGDGGDPVEAARLVQAFQPFLSDPIQEVRETAALAHGILGSSRAIPALSHLVWDTESGRKLVKAGEVDYRTRAFAAYGLGLIGARTTDEIERKLIVSVLRRTYEQDDTRTRDLGVASLIALGLVPLATIDSALVLGDDDEVPPESSRLAQLAFVLRILRDDRLEYLARAQCPITLARLLVGLPEPYFTDWRTEIARELLERAEYSRERIEVVQSCILALGQIGTNDGKDELDTRIRRTLAQFVRNLSDPAARGFALMALAETGARFGQQLTSQGIEDARDFLCDQTINGKSVLRPWAGLASGVMCYRLQQQAFVHPAQETIRRVLHLALEDERSPVSLGAYALGAGLARSTDSSPRLMKLLEKDTQDDVRGQIALALALLGQRKALEPLHEIVEKSKYRPELLQQAAIALAILGDKNVPSQLVTLLGEARSLASQAAIASALGFIGDQRSVEPLLALLGDRLSTDKARAFAAVALGKVTDKELLPWNSKIAAGLNYLAAPATLSDPIAGTGVLDIL